MKTLNLTPYQAEILQAALVHIRENAPKWVTDDDDIINALSSTEGALEQVTGVSSKCFETP